VPWRWRVQHRDSHSPRRRFLTLTPLDSRLPRREPLRFLRTHGVFAGTVFGASGVERLITAPVERFEPPTRPLRKGSRCRWPSRICPARSHGSVVEKSSVAWQPPPRQPSLHAARVYSDPEGRASRCKPWLCVAGSPEPVTASTLAPNPRPRRGSGARRASDTSLGWTAPE